MQIAKSAKRRKLLETTEKFHQFAFKLAEKRKIRGKKGSVTCVDKANVFIAMAFFRKIFDETVPRYPNIKASYNYVDAQALKLIQNPWDYDVLVMENMFGDILSDLAGGLVGGMGMAPCGEIGDDIGFFQPAHGSAPDLIGRDAANPIAAILSAALMLEYLYEKTNNRRFEEAALLIEHSIEDGFNANALRPKEFGGDMGTILITSVIRELVKTCDID